MTVSNIQAKKLLYNFKCPHCNEEPYVDYLNHPDLEFSGLAHNPGNVACVDFDNEFNTVYKQHLAHPSTTSVLNEWLWKYRG